MGGGDLNLKKSWHPLTMQNLERVWKAEQRHDAEQKRIEELQTEIRQERAREEMQKMAVEVGITKAKAERVDWLYSGHASMVNREEYLLGKKIDKMVDPLLMESEREKQALESGAGALFSGTDSANTTTDLAAKIREDPLFMMRKKEEEAKKQLLDNPVRLKQLREILSKKKHKSSKKKKSHHHESDSDSESERHHRSYPTSSHGGDRRRRNDYHDYKRHQRRDRSRSPVNSSSRERSTRDDGREKLWTRRERHDGGRSTGSGRPPAREGRGPSNITKRMDPAELEQRRKEMMESARQKDRERESRVGRHRKEVEAEEAEAISGKKQTFIQPLKVESLTSSQSLEDRIHRNIYSVQRTKSALTSEGFLKK